MRTTLGQVRVSMLPQSVGLCQDDTPGIARIVNRAQQILVNVGGETGWWGGWQKVVFTANRCNPYITLPREFARAINLDVCRFPIKIQNQFYEFLPDGIGLQDFRRLQNGVVSDWCGALEGYERNTVVTMVDLTPTNQLLRVYMTDPRDVNKRVLIGPAKDQNGNFIYTQDGPNSVNGFYLNLQAPFTTTTFVVTDIGGIQKDATFGDVLLYQVDATTGTQVLLSRFAPDEITPAYRRYFINRMPCTCNHPACVQSPCVVHNVGTGNIPVSALVKLEFIPVNRDTDFLIIGNIPALIEECKAVRYSDMDAKNAPALEAKSHARAVKMLNDELRHYLGELNPAVNVAPWGTARLSRPMSAVRNG